MKTIEQLADRIADISAYDGICAETVESILQDWAKEICKEQDKITRHACAKAVLEIEKHAIDGTQFDTGVREALKSAHQAIMNVDAVKKV